MDIPTIHTTTESNKKVDDASTSKSCDHREATAMETDGEKNDKVVEKSPGLKPQDGDSTTSITSSNPTQNGDTVAAATTAPSISASTLMQEGDATTSITSSNPMQNGDAAAVATSVTASALTQECDATTSITSSNPTQNGDAAAAATAATSVSASALTQDVDMAAATTSITSSNPTQNGDAAAVATSVTASALTQEGDTAVATTSIVTSDPTASGSSTDKSGAVSATVATGTATITVDTPTQQLPPKPPTVSGKTVNSKTDKSLSNLTNQKYGPFIHADEESDDEKGNVTKTMINPNVEESDSTKKDDVVMMNNDANIGKVDDNTSSNKPSDTSNLQLGASAADKNQSACNTLTTITPSNHTNNNDTTTNTNNVKKVRKEFETDRDETSWEKVLLDAEEFESLMFSIRRPTARNRLQMLVKQMKQLSAKLKRHHEVMYVLRATEIAKKEVGKKRKINPVESIGRSDALPNGQATNSAIAGGGNGNINSMNANVVGSKRIKLEVGEGKGGTKAGGTNGTQVNIPLFAMDRTARPNAALGTTSSGTPILKEKDKFVHHHRFGSDLHCPDFDATGKCPLGAICHHLHVYRPPSNITTKTRKYYTRDDLKRAYETQRKITLTRVEFSEKIKADALNVPKYTLGFTCPIDKTIYYAQPFLSDKVHNALTQNGGGVKSIQGVWWYRNMKEASEALSTIVLEDLIRRKVIADRFQPERTVSVDGELHRKKSASARAAILARTACVENTPVLKQTRVAQVGLPQIHPWNWMEVHYEARCIAFHSVRGCNRGSRCRNAHVHYPTPKIAGDTGHPNGKFPDLGAMPRAYYENFGMVLEDLFFRGEGCGDMSVVRGRGMSSFKTKSAVDVRSQIWYTAAWKCPREGTIYYAAGGACGRVNSQNMFLYPSVEQAKLAACGVVLDGFLKRGMRGDWEVSKVPQKSIGRSRAGMLSLSPNRNRIPASTPDHRWLDGKSDNRGLIPHWQATLDCAVAPQPQVRSVDRNVRYIKSGMDPRLLSQVTNLSSPMNGGGSDRIEVSHMMRPQTRSGINSFSDNLTGDDQGLEEELFG